LSFRRATPLNMSSKAVELDIDPDDSNGQTFICTFQWVLFQKTVRQPVWRWL
jgi:hypothetical protein